MALKVCFVLPDLSLSGGIGTVVRHARGLSNDHGMDVTLALTNEEAPRWEIPELEGLSVKLMSELTEEHFDVAIATWWRTCYQVFDLKADRHCYFIQSLEDRFYAEAGHDRLSAAVTHGLPFTFITEANWIAEFLRKLRPETPCYYVRNGIDKATFKRDSELTPSNGKLKVLLEGHHSVWFKGIPEALEALEHAQEPLVTTWVTPASRGKKPRGIDRMVGPLSSEEMANEFANADIVLKTSKVEGMYGPPLEGFHCGATCITTPVTGHEEYIRHGHNAVIIDWDDPIGAGRALDLLSVDRAYLHNLRSNAMVTAQSWPAWRQSTEMFAAILTKIREDDPPAMGPSMRHLVQQVEHTCFEADRVIGKNYREAARQLSVIRNGVTMAIARKVLQKYRGVRRRLRNMKKRIAWRLR